MEDLLKERIQPYPDEITRSKSFTVQETQSVSRHQSPIPPPPSPPAAPPLPDDTAIAVPTPPILTPLPRLPTPPLTPVSPPPDKPASPPPSPEKPISPPPEELPTAPPEKTPTPPVEQNVPQVPESPPPYIINYEKIRRGRIDAKTRFSIQVLFRSVGSDRRTNYSCTGRSNSTSERS